MPSHSEILVGAAIVRRDQLTDGVVGEMYRLMNSVFCNVDESNFLYDLSQKQYAIIAREGNGRLIGFSTIQVYERQFGGKPLLVLFSGDTVMNREYSHRNLIAGPFTKFMLGLIAVYPAHQRIWLLLSKGYRTYRFLPVYFNSFVPRPDDKAGGQELLAIRDSLAADKYGDLYCRCSGVVAHHGSRDSLREIAIPQWRQSDPYISYFHSQNPGWVNGDELVCAAEIKKENFNGRIWRAASHCEASMCEIG